MLSHTRQGIKKQAYRVLEENEYLQQQLQEQINRENNIDQVQREESNIVGCLFDCRSTLIIIIAVVHCISHESNATFNGC
jgi:uncharacterized membrane protein